LAGDNYEQSKNILIQNDRRLIIKPHDGDTYQLESNTRVALRSSQPAAWQVNGQDAGYGGEIIYTPESAGTYLITAVGGGKNESVTINFVKK